MTTSCGPRRPSSKPAGAEPPFPTGSTSALWLPSHATAVYSGLCSGHPECPQRRLRNQSAITVGGAFFHSSRACCAGQSQPGRSCGCAPRPRAVSYNVRRARRLTSRRVHSPDERNAVQPAPAGQTPHRWDGRVGRSDPWAHRPLHPRYVILLQDCTPIAQKYLTGLHRCGAYCVTTQGPVTLVPLGAAHAGGRISVPVPPIEADETMPPDINS